MCACVRSELSADRGRAAAPRMDRFHLRAVDIGFSSGVLPASDLKQENKARCVGQRVKIILRQLTLRSRRVMMASGRF